jgi:hypothetical protein
MGRGPSELNLDKIYQEIKPERLRPQSAERIGAHARPNPRKLSMRALLSDVAPNETPIFVPRLIGERPRLAALIAETISTWSFAEHALGRSVAAMSRGINSAEMEAYIADTRLRARLKIVRRVARAELPDPYLTLFLKVLNIIKSLAHRRHAFAHSVWGAVEALPTDLLLVDPKHLLRHWGAANDWLAAFSEGGPGAVNPIGFDNRHIEVWSEADLKEEIARMNQAFELALALEMLASVDTFDASNARRTNAHSWLLRHQLVTP